MKKEQETEGEGNMEEGPKEVIQPHMDQPCGLGGGDSDIAVLQTKMAAS